MGIYVSKNKKHRFRGVWSSVPCDSQICQDTRDMPPQKSSKGLSLEGQSFFDIVFTMPAKNTLKMYIDDGYYHLYNRGVNKMPIFNDEQDYRVFLRYLKTYLIPKDYDALNLILTDTKTSQQIRAETLKELNLKNFHGKITLIGYCLMPNHFHLLVHTKSGHDMEYFMRSLMTRYTQYMNRKYTRVGPLFQGRYKAVLVETTEQLLYLTRYIHRNPLEAYLNQQKIRTVLCRHIKHI